MQNVRFFVVVVWLFVAVVTVRSRTGGRTDGREASCNSIAADVAEETVDEP